VAKRQNARTPEHYVHKLRYAVSAFGERALQKITVQDIDNLTGDLKGKVSEGTRRHVFVATKACLSAAVRKGYLENNPASRAEGVDVEPIEVGEKLPREQFAAFLEGFIGHPLHDIVVVALHTGARLNEVLAIRQCDVDLEQGVLRISRAVERTKAYGVRFKAPKAGKVRELAIDSDLVLLFRRNRDRLLGVLAGVTGVANVDLSLVKLPEDALVFWMIPRAEPVRYSKPLNDTHVSRTFRVHAAKLGYPKLRFHDLRGSHETALLDAGIPLHVVAARCGHSPTVLLTSYAKRTQSADRKAADAMAAIFKTSH
jgi:integrase